MIVSSTAPVWVCRRCWGWYWRSEEQGLCSSCAALLAEPTPVYDGLVQSWTAPLA